MNRNTPRTTDAKQYIIATSALLANPVMLAHSSARHLIIPIAVQTELSTRLRGSAGADILKVIANVNNLEFPSTPIDVSDGFEKWNLTDVDEAVARIAISRANQVGAENVVVVTQNVLLKNFLAGKRIESFTSRSLLKAWASDSLDRNTQASIKSYSQKQWRSVIFPALGGIGASILMVAGFTYSEQILDALSSVVVAMLLGILGIALYWFRQKHRLPYGLAEWLIGLFITYKALSSPQNSELILQGIQIAGGLYAMVRGLDNLGKGFQGTYFEALWGKFFKEAQ